MHSCILREYEVIFEDGHNTTTMPLLVCYTGEKFHPCVGPGVQLIPLAVLIYTIQRQSSSLVETTVEVQMGSMVVDH